MRQLSGVSSTVNRTSLIVLARQLGQQVVVPSLVVEEAAEARRRDLQEALDAHEDALAAVERLFGTEGHTEFDPYPDPDVEAELLKKQLEEWTEIIETTADHMVEGLRREITRQRPTVSRDRKSQSATGGRDAAIWATVRDHHRSLTEPGYLVTGDGGFAHEGRLHADLQTELGDQKIELHQNIDTILGELGKVTPAPEMTLTDLGRLGTSALVEGLQRHPAMARAVLSSESQQSWRVRARVMKATATKVESAQLFAAGGDEVRVASGLWDVEAEMIAGRDVGNNLLKEFSIGTARLEIRAQVSIADDESRLVGAHVVRSDLYLHISEDDDGKVMTLRRIEDPPWHSTDPPATQ